MSLKRNNAPKRVVDINGSRVTPFQELLIAQRTSRLNLKPTWGVSQLRDAKTETGTGASVAEQDGEIRLQTGTTTGNVAQIQTKERAQYQAGAEGETGIGIRIPTAPTGTQFAEWGFFDDNNGFGFGVDVTGKYVFYLTGGTKTKTYQTNWNVDKLDGTGDSQETLDLSEGYIFAIDFTWYGYGSIKYYCTFFDEGLAQQDRIKCHVTDITQSVSIVDPNQPLTVRCENGGTSTSNFNVYVGGRQFSFVDGENNPQKRNTPITREAFSLTSATYVPVLAVRLKSTFNGRANSVKAFVKSLSIGADKDIFYYVSYGDTVTDGSWGAISTVTASETAMEQNTTLTAGGTTQYRAFIKDAIYASTARRNNQSNRTSVVFGSGDVVVVWARHTGTNASVNLTLNVEEEW